MYSRPEKRIDMTLRQQLAGLTRDLAEISLWMMTQYDRLQNKGVVHEILGDIRRLLQTARMTLGGKCPVCDEYKDSVGEYNKMYMCSECHKQTFMSMPMAPMPSGWFVSDGKPVLFREGQTKLVPVPKEWMHDIQGFIDTLETEE